MTRIAVDWTAAIALCLAGERGTRIYAFALNMDIHTEADAAKRIPVGRELLAQLDVLSTPSTADSVVR